MKSLILLLILAFLSPAHAQMSCMDLFNHTRPSEEQINTAIFDLAYLMSERYSKDPQVAAFAKSESQKKISELEQYLTIDEIKSRFKQTVVLNKYIQEKLVQNKLKESGEILLEELALLHFFKKNKMKDISFKNHNRSTTLMIAVIQEQTEIVKILIKRGIDVNAQSKTQSTALLYAALGNNIEIAKILLENNANIHAISSNGLTILAETASSTRDKAAISEFLIQNGADVNSRSPNNNTPLMAAAEMNNKEIAKVLLQYKADVNAQNNDGKTALMYAVEARYAGFIKLLLENGADFTIKSNEGKTVLTLAHETGYTSIVRILKEAGATE